jgi:uncharacterized protein (TIGR03000 family)
MSKRSISIPGILALAVFGVLCGHGRTLAQYYYQRASSYPFVSSIDAPDTYGRYTEGPGFFYRSWVAPPDAPEEQVAYIHVRVSPPDAEISFEGSKTSQIGSSRLYVSPPLVPGENYTYDIRVSWKENGREVTRARKVAVRAGDRLSVVFRAPATTASTATLQTAPSAQP